MKKHFFTLFILLLLCHQGVFADIQMWLVGRAGVNTNIDTVRVFARGTISHKVSQWTFSLVVDSTAVEVKDYHLLGFNTPLNLNMIGKPNNKWEDAINLTYNSNSYNNRIVFSDATSSTPVALTTATEGLLLMEYYVQRKVQNAKIYLETNTLPDGNSHPLNFISDENDNQITCFILPDKQTVIFDTPLNNDPQQTPLLTLSVSNLSFPEIEVGTSHTLQYTLSASNLQGNLTLTTTDAFDISLSSASGFGKTLSLTPTSGSIPTTTIYVKYSPTAVGTNTASVLHASLNLNNSEVLLSGSAFASPQQPPSSPSSPTISLSVSSINLGYYLLGDATYPTSTFDINASNLNENISISAPVGFEIATNANGPFSSNITLTPSAGGGGAGTGSVNTTVYVRFVPSTEGNFSGNLNVQYSGQVLASSMVSALSVNPAKVVINKGIFEVKSNMPIFIKGTLINQGQVTSKSNITITE